MPIKIEENISSVSTSKREPDQSGDVASQTHSPLNFNDSRETTMNQIAPLFGVYPALVSDNVDPDNIGRVKIRLPWMSGDDDIEIWARVATLMAGNERGTFFIPEVDDEVLVAFEAGQAQRPYVVGALWNGQDKPPVTNYDANNKKQICSRSGIKITFDDDQGQEQLTCETPAGQTITLKDGPATIEIKDSYNNKITMDATGIRVGSNSSVKLNGSMVELDASMLTVNAGYTKFSGVVQCDTLITSSVISASYTPGAGNIW